VTVCTLCRRSLLAGEHYRRWEPGVGRGPRPVCQLCEQQAAQSGWVRTDTTPVRDNGTGLRWSVRLVA
jgi:hypothetical protein